MKKLSVKLGIMFFLTFFSLITFMFFFLHEGIVDSRVNEELNALQSRGNSHRSVLEKNFDKETLSHVVLMESESSTDIVVTDQNEEILSTSGELQYLKKYLDMPNSDVPHEGQIIKSNWKNESFIVTISPILQQGKTIGYVYMFQDTASIHLLINILNEHFLIAGWISVILTIIIIIFLTRVITKPLIKMKEATYQISKGNFSVSLPQTSNDELGDLRPFCFYGSLQVFNP